MRSYTIAGGAGAAAVPSIQQAQDEISAELREMVESQSVRLGVRADYVGRMGNPFSEIVKLAGELPADAVIVGASAKAGVHSQVLGIDATLPVPKMSAQMPGDEYTPAMSPEWAVR